MGKTRIYRWMDDIGMLPEGAAWLGEDLCLYELRHGLDIGRDYSEPFLMNATTAVICSKGSTHGFVGMSEYRMDGPGMLIVLPSQVLRYGEISPDFEGRFIVMSDRFAQNLRIPQGVETFFGLLKSPYIPLDAEALSAMNTYFDMMLRLVGVRDNPYQQEAIANLTRAFFYGAGYYFHKSGFGSGKESGPGSLLDRFLEEVKRHYRRERKVEFYAGKLCLTPKYLSTSVRKASGRTASEWIDSFVMLDAKAMLRSTDMTVQQVSEALGFPSQSFFGKYFKRNSGMSPNAYRHGK